MVPTSQTAAVPRSSAGMNLRSPQVSSSSSSSSGSRQKSALHKSAATMTSTSRGPIPLPSTHISRTVSEIQLCEDMVVAEWREMCMFQRLVAGMKERKEARPISSDSRDSRLVYGYTNPVPAPPKIITPHESPCAYIDDTAPFRLGEPSDIPHLPGVTTTKTSSSSSWQQGNDWFVEDNFEAATAVASTVDDSNDDEDIFSMDI